MVAELVGQLERSIYPMVSKMSRAVAKSAVLMGGSNELVECFCGGAVAEGCSGAVARLVGDSVEVGLVAGDGGSCGQVSADESVGVVVGSSLPGAVGMSDNTSTPVPGVRRWWRAISRP